VVSKLGAYDLETEIFRRDGPGRWSSMGSGGSHGSGWDVPFPPSTGWPFEGLAIMGLQGTDVEGEDCADLALDAIYGFIAPPACSVRVIRDGHARNIEPAAGTRAFVVLTLGAAFLTPLDDDGRAVGPGQSYGHKPGPPPNQTRRRHGSHIGFRFGRPTDDPE
jgi:hypothetical protein